MPSSRALSAEIRFSVVQDMLAAGTFSYPCLEIYKRQLQSIISLVVNELYPQSKNWDTLIHAPIEMIHAQSMMQSKRAGKGS